MEQVNGLIHSIEPFGTVDGPGIRMVLFCSTCPLQCKFCHNPDVAWGKSSKVFTPTQLLTIYQKNHHFYKNGGITFSGGEPLTQGEFIYQCTERMKNEGIHIALDTSLSCGTKWIEKLAKKVDLWMVSIKAISPSLHRKLTNCDNSSILARIKLLDSLQVSLRIRYLIIPSLTDFPDELGKLATFILSLRSDTKLELLAYHTMGREKWDQLDLKYKLQKYRDATSDDINQAKLHLQQNGIKNTQFSV